MSMSQKNTAKNHLSSVHIPCTGFVYIMLHTYTLYRICISWQHLYFLFSIVTNLGSIHVPCLGFVYIGKIEGILAAYIYNVQDSYILAAYI